ncbi:protein of unknown function [Rhodovastum atsumiense]|nr:protein of unknown function [Rhodovastum atsumiense]
MFPISDRDLEPTLADHGVEVDDTTAPTCIFRTAPGTWAGYEAMATVRKGQVHGTRSRDMKAQAAFIAGLFQIATTRSAFAAIVRPGLTPPFVGMNEASTT